LFVCESDHKISIVWKKLYPISPQAVKNAASRAHIHLKTVFILLLLIYSFNSVQYIHCSSSPSCFGSRSRNRQTWQHCKPIEFGFNLHVGSKWTVSSQIYVFKTNDTHSPTHRLLAWKHLRRKTGVRKLSCFITQSLSEDKMDS